MALHPFYWDSSSTKAGVDTEMWGKGVFKSGVERPGALEMHCMYLLH